jgi:formate dehydrogenase subunit beta
MSTQWSLKTHGDPLGKFRSFLKQIWAEAKLDGMVVTLFGSIEEQSSPQYVTDVSAIAEINPFKPLMEANLARFIPGVLKEHPNAKIGTLFRPCEMRAFIEMAKHASLKLDNLLTISVDCLGTLPADEYQWRLERLGKKSSAMDNQMAESGDRLAHEALKFARHGGIIHYRFRPACQVCRSSASENADINVHVLGLPVRQVMLVSSDDPGIEERLQLHQLTDGLADSQHIAQHERTLSKMNERHQRTMERVKESIAHLLPADVDAVIQQLENCTECRSCMEACPICSVVQPARNEHGHYDRSSVLRWLISCAGCGMCEQSCPNQLPIAAFFAHIHQQLAEEWQYISGRSVDEPLPFFNG